jgi:hypothetical protein
MYPGRPFSELGRDQQKQQPRPPKSFAVVKIRLPQKTIRYIKVKGVAA